MTYNTHHFRGSPYEAGYSVGRLVGAQLGKLSERLIETWPKRDGTIDQAMLNKGALPWIDRLPERYRQEICGLADGSGVPLAKIAEGYFAEECCCSSFITTLDDSHAWVGRNNDAWAPELWHGVTVHEVDGRMSRIGFGIEAETSPPLGLTAIDSGFTATEDPHSTHRAERSHVSIHTSL